LIGLGSPIERLKKNPGGSGGFRQIVLKIASPERAKNVVGSPQEEERSQNGPRAPGPFKPFWKTT